MESNSNQIQSYSQQPSSGLLRFRSAPSFLFGNSCEGSESERLFSRFVNFGGNDNDSESLNDNKSAVITTSLTQRCSSNSSTPGLPPHYPRHSPAAGGAASLENISFGLVGASMAAADNSSLVRQSSSPAGLFSHHLSVPNGYGAIKGATNYGGLEGSQGEVSPSTNRLKTQLSFSSRLPSSLGMLSQISEVGSDNLGASTLDEEKLRNGNSDARFYGTGFPFGSWNDSSNFTDNYGGLRRDQENNRKLCSGTQNEDLGNRIQLLSRHLSLPKNSAEVAMEKYLHFQDSVPCKVRAKRGCATHPRSIAERVRRTRISERMRKLQELVPNMDKQTNTADMLDLAVEYIKDLQKQFKTLSDNRANCKCLTMQKAIPNQVV